MCWLHSGEDLIISLTNQTVRGANYYNYLISIGDKRVEKWPLMSSPWPTVAITAMYLLTCLIGPKVMSHFPPQKLRPVIVTYNLATAGLNAYIGIEIFLTSRSLAYNWTCQPVDYSNDPRAVRIAAALWWYYFSKCIELLDSLFILLRKNFHQLTFLHIYHHATMFPLWWIGAKYVAGGSSFLGAFFNCLVHVVMYSYYAVAALGPSMKRFLWWKKYLTLLQMVQFVAALVMGCNAIRIGCDFPMWMQYTLVAYMVSFLVLFSNFYYKAYITDRELRKANEVKNGVKNGVGKANVVNGVNGANGINGIHSIDSKKKN